MSVYSASASNRLLLCSVVTVPCWLTSLHGLWNMPETGKQRPHSTLRDFILPAFVSVRWLLSQHHENSPLELFLSCGWQPKAKKKKRSFTAIASNRSRKDDICHVTVLRFKPQSVHWPSDAQSTNFRKVNMSRTFYILSFGLAKKLIYTHGSLFYCFLYSCSWRLLCHYLIQFY